MTEDDDTTKPLTSVRSATGKGALIIGHGADRRYGHVEICVEPTPDSDSYVLDWSVPDGMLLPEQRAIIMATAQQFLDAFMRKQPICGFTASITMGSWLGDARNDAYDRATEIALTEALHNANITTKVA